VGSSPGFYPGSPPDSPLTKGELEGVLEVERKPSHTNQVKAFNSLSPMWERVRVRGCGVSE
jgi:hypothetical protein